MKPSRNYSNKKKTEEKKLLIDAEAMNQIKSHFTISWRSYLQDGYQN